MWPPQTPCPNCQRFHVESAVRLRCRLESEARPWHTSTRRQRAIARCLRPCGVVILDTRSYSQIVHGVSKPLSLEDWVGGKLPQTPGNKPDPLTPKKGAVFLVWCSAAPKRTTKEEGQTKRLRRKKSQPQTLKHQSPKRLKCPSGSEQSQVRKQIEGLQTWTKGYPTNR